MGRHCFNEQLDGGFRKIERDGAQFGNIVPAKHSNRTGVTGRIVGNPDVVQKR